MGEEQRSRSDVGHNREPDPVITSAVALLLIASPRVGRGRRFQRRVRDIVRRKCPSRRTSDR